MIANVLGMAIQCMLVLQREMVAGVENRLLQKTNSYWHSRSEFINLLLFDPFHFVGFGFSLCGHHAVMDGSGSRTRRPRRRISLIIRPSTA